MRISYLNRRTRSHLFRNSYKEFRANVKSSSSYIIRSDVMFECEAKMTMGCSFVSRPMLFRHRICLSKALSAWRAVSHRWLMRGAPSLALQANVATTNGCWLTGASISADIQLQRRKQYFLLTCVRQLSCASCVTASTCEHSGRVARYTTWWLYCVECHNKVFGSKRSAICAQAVYFLHSTMPSVTCLRLSNVSVICHVTYYQFSI